MYNVYNDIYIFFYLNTIIYILKFVFKCSRSKFHQTIQCIIDLALECIDTDCPSYLDLVPPEFLQTFKVYETCLCLHELIFVLWFNTNVLTIAGKKRGLWSTVM